MDSPGRERRHTIGSPFNGGSAPGGGRSSPSYRRMTSEGSLKAPSSPSGARVTEVEAESDALNVLPEAGALAFRSLKYLPFKTVEMVSKINRVGRHQDRLLVITDTHIYSSLPHDGDVQRCILMDDVTECRVCRPRLEVALIVPAEYNYLAQFYEQKALQRLLTCLPASAKIIDEVTPLDFHALNVEKPEKFSRAPLPVATLVLPKWSQKQQLRPVGVEDDDGARQRALSKKPLRFESEQRRQASRAATSVGDESESDFLDAARSGRKEAGFASGTSNGNRWIEMAPVEVGDGSDPSRRNDDAHDDDDDDDSGVERRSGQRAAHSLKASNSGATAAAAAASDRHLSLALGPSSHLDATARGGAGGGGGGPGGQATVAFRTPLATHDDDDEDDQPPPPPPPPEEEEEAASNGALGTPNSRTHQSPPSSSVSMRKYNGSFGGGGGAQRGGPPLQGMALLSATANGRAQVTGGDDGDDDFHHYSKYDASPSGSMPVRRKDGTINPEVVAEHSETVRDLRQRLAAEQRRSAALAKDLTEVLEAKRFQEASLQRQLDELRGTVDKLVKENLRLRRPWALDL